MPKNNPNSANYTPVYNSFTGADVEIWVVIQPPALLGDGAQPDPSAKIDKLKKQLLIEKQELLKAEDRISRIPPAELGFETDSVLIELNEIQLNQTKVITRIENEIKSLTGGAGTGVYKKMAECSTIDYSIFREKRPVRAIGSTAIRGITQGPRTIAGSMISVIFDKAVMHELLTGISSNGDPRLVLVDQIPPVDIFIFFSNEYGAVSRMVIYGAEFMNEGQVISVNDLYTENQVNYLARDIDTLAPITGDYDPNIVTRSDFNTYNIIQTTYEQTARTLRLARLGLS